MKLKTFIRIEARTDNSFFYLPSSAHLLVCLMWVFVQNCPLLALFSFRAQRINLSKNKWWFLAPFETTYKRNQECYIFLWLKNDLRWCETLILKRCKRFFIVVIKKLLGQKFSKINLQRKKTNWCDSCFFPNYQLRFELIYLSERIFSQTVHICNIYLDRLKANIRSHNWSLCSLSQIHWSNQ